MKGVIGLLVLSFLFGLVLWSTWFHGYPDVHKIGKFGNTIIYIEGEGEK